MSLVCSKNKANNDERSRGVAREVIAAYHMTTAWIVYVMQRLRMNGAASLLTLRAFMACKETTLPLPFICKG